MRRLDRELQYAVGDFVNNEHSLLSLHALETGEGPYGDIVKKIQSLRFEYEDLPSGEQTTDLKCVQTLVIVVG
jgi:hypothetical protein